jgi:dipeptidyl aminopeptidase/acylaminoacyl peptidase
MKLSLYVARFRVVVSVLALAVLCAVPVFAQTGMRYQKPPQPVEDVLNAPPTPNVLLSPQRDYMLLVESPRYPAIADLAQPMLRLAGTRINGNTNGPHLSARAYKLTLKAVQGGAERVIALPAGARVAGVAWSADGKMLAFSNTLADGIELWVCDVATAKARVVKGARLNTAVGGGFQWMPDQRTLLAQLVPDKRGPAPAASSAPDGPNVQESAGKPGPVRTFQDLLKTPHDEQLFEYYATSQLALIDANSGKITKVGAPAIFNTVSPSPNGQNLLVARIHRPFSYLYPFTDFPKTVEVWDSQGKKIHQLAELPLEDYVPIEGVPTGPRNYGWRPTDPATLVWAEALDGGDPRKKVSPRDKVVMLKAPFTGPPTELCQTEQRLNGLQWGERDGLVFVRDFDRDKRLQRTFAYNADNPSQPPTLIWSRNASDRYGDPGQPVTRTLPNGRNAMLQHGDAIYLAGAGATPDGERPFLRRYNLKTKQTEELFRSRADAYESFTALLDDDAKAIVIRRETPSTPPNFYFRPLAIKDVEHALTNFPDPTPSLRGITKQLVKYKRADGVDLSFTLYLPPGYKPGTRLPTVVWAYPLEFTDAGVAGQVSGSPNRFTAIGGMSHLFFVLQGYAVLDDATMPIVGNPETVNNTFVEQIVGSAKAAIDKATEMGVTDPDRVGVGGHSYGAFMTANLLAHSDLFRAGIARSGAYNRTLTPFGFQSERRTFWDAPDLYMKVSPFVFANKINEPILLMHGEADNNQGTFPIQSDRMFQAIRGNGGTVRLVTLPLEAHGYAARESIGHTLYEMMSWFDKHVKNAPPRNKTAE